VPGSLKNIAIFINGYTRYLEMPNYGWHRHNTMEIIYIKSGAGKVNFQNSDTIEFKKNDLFIYWPNTVHAIEITRPCEEIVIKLNPIGLHTTGDEGHPHYISDLDDEFLLNELLRLSQKRSTHSPKTSEQIKNLRATALLFELLNIEPLIETKEEVSILTKLEQVKAFLENNFSKIFSVSEATDHLDISYEYLRHRFKEKYSISMKQYLMKVRIDHAKWLLSNSKTSLAEVATECGFDNERYFCTRFRKETGTTPGVYRKRTQGYGFI